MTDLNTAIITTIIGAIVGPIIVESFKMYLKRSKSEQHTGEKDPPQSKTKNIAMILTWIMVGALFGLFLGLAIISHFWSPGEKSLWTFDNGIDSWQYVQQKDGDHFASTNLSWDKAAVALRAEFDFGQVDPSKLSNGDEPRATYFINLIKDDWAGYKTLLFDVDNLTSQPLKTTFTIWVGNCWYEFGDYQPVPPLQKTSVSFDLSESIYKNCNSYSTYNNPAVLFNPVTRFDITLSMNNPLADWSKVKGEVLIDKLRLEK